ncbi:hypothetical protein ACHAWO_013547 [Cyclotella atomus]|jgi:hypothetical protein|uniref:Uncharacterized protein n=1 Tax=Cyclotella atomus TaxID=382360 RepID=A0ABD3PSB8_9STRA
MTEEVSIAPTDASVAGSSVALTEAEEDAASYAARSEKEFTLPINFNKGDASIAPTDASVAGSSVAATEADEDALYADPNATINEVVLTNVTVQEGDEEDVAPMHLHVLRTPAKLKGTASSVGRRSRSSSRSRPGSRRNSNSPSRGGLVSSPSGGSLKPSLGDAASHASSVDEDVDPDILLDKFGFQDLDPKLTQEDFQELLKKHLGANSLPTLNERMSEETMEDVHAFQDLVFVKKNKGSSGTGSPSSGSMGQSIDLEEAGSDNAVDAQRASLTNFSGLAALNEEEEDEEDDEHAGPDGENDSSDAEQSLASSISGDDIKLTESELHEEGGDVVVELPDPSMIQKEHDKAAAIQDPSVMAVEDKSDNEELNLADEEAVELPTEVMEELRISDECRLKGQKSKEYDTTEGDETEGR